MNDYDGGLSTPEIIKVGTRYEVIWGDIDSPDMKWTVDRVETSRGGDPNCEIQIEDLTPEDRQTIIDIRMQNESGDNIK